jgi:polyisoprenoid-binding protein YceI
VVGGGTVGSKGTLGGMSVSKPRTAVLRLALLMTAFVGTATAAPVAYQYDPVHSQVVFSVDHNGFSRSFGRLHVSGNLSFDATNWSHSSTHVVIDTAGVDMGDAKWNDAVRGNDLFAAARFPTATFDSTSVEKTGDDTGVLHGKLTMRGVSQPVDIPFRLNRNGRTIYGMHDVAGFSANFTLDRTLFGMTSNPNSIGRSVAVWLEIEAIRSDDAGSKESDRGTAQ